MNSVNLIKKAQKICMQRKVTAKTWLEFCAVANQATDEADKAMLGDLATGLIRELVANNITYDEDALL